MINAGPNRNITTNFFASLLFFFLSISFFILAASLGKIISRHERPLVRSIASWLNARSVRLVRESPSPSV